MAAPNAAAKRDDNVLRVKGWPTRCREAVLSTSISTAHAGAEDARLAPDGGTLWVVDTGAAKLSAFAVDGGNLTELPSSPTTLPAGSAPFGIVVT